MVGHISRSFIDELISRVDIVDLIDSYVPLRKDGKNYKAGCPFHADKTPSFTVSPEKQFYYCFGCGAHGSAIGFLINYAGLDFVEAVHELAARVGVEVVYERGSTPVSTNDFEDLYSVMAQAADYYRQQLRQSPAAIAYLKNRGITGEIARDFGLGYAPPGWNNLLKTLSTHSDMPFRLLKAGLIKQNDSGHRYDRFRDRVMFPILNQRGQVIAFGGRKIHENNNDPKYLNSPETPLFKKGHELYGWYFARKTRPLPRVIVVEGYMDVVALAQYGIRNVVATLGTATTHEHLTHLFVRRVSEIVFCFDADEGGQTAAWRALKAVLPFLQGDRQVSFVFLPLGSDPDSLVRREGAEGFNTYLNQAKPLSDFLFENLKQQIDLANPNHWNSVEGKNRLVEKVTPLLKELPVGPYRDLMEQKLSDLTGVNRKNSATLKRGAEVIEPVAQMVESMRQLPLVHQAIMCLLHKPMLSQSIEYPNEKLSRLNQKDINLLLELIELLRRNPQLNLGAICEHWRETKYEHILNQLATQPTLITSDYVNIDEEFFGTIDRLEKDYKKQRLAALSEQITKLSPEEKQELRSLYEEGQPTPHCH